MRKFLAVILILVGVGVAVFFGIPHAGPDQQDVVAVHHQKEQVQKVKQGKNLLECHSHALIKYLGHTEPIEQGVRASVLDSGVVGHFPGTGPVGRGNYALTGHVVTHGEPFRYMPNLQVGDKVEVDKCAHRYIFEVKRKFTVYYTDVSILKYRPHTLTLVTCASRIVHTDYRTVVSAHLTDTRPWR